MRNEVVVGLGTNLEDRVGHLRRGVRGLKALAPELVVLAQSPVYESDALVPEGAPDDWARPYLNMAVRASFDGTPEILVERLKTLEAQLGRAQRARWAPREVDLDLLAVGGLRRDSDGLRLPHHGLVDRPFALLPFADVWPDWVYPGDPDSGGRSAAELAARWAGGGAHVPFRTRRTSLALTEIVGILNVTPDSFSDGGRHLEAGPAVDHAVRMVAEGADVIDVGAESTRPGGATIDEAEEWRRLEPVLGALVSHRLGATISVDTRHPLTATRALDAGADWVNDVLGGQDPAMVSVVRSGACDLVVMHSLTIPPSGEAVIPADRDPVATLTDWGNVRLAALERAGISRARIIFDPGVGFGKTAEQSALLVRRAGAFAALGTRVLVGHSRKSFLRGWYPPGSPGATDASARDFESALIAGWLASSGVDYVRVHDVAHARRAIALSAALG